jgi:hypothetical protein
MKVLVFTALTGLAGLFMLIAAVAKDRVNLYPAGVLLLLTGFFLMSGQGLEVATGETRTYTEVNNQTVVESVSNTYSTVEFPVESVDINQLTGFVMLIMSLYFFYIPSKQLRFRSIARRFSGR